MGCGGTAGVRVAGGMQSEHGVLRDRWGTRGQVGCGEKTLAFLTTVLLSILRRIALFSVTGKSKLLHDPQAQPARPSGSFSRLGFAPDPGARGPCCQSLLPPLRPARLSCGAGGAAEGGAAGGGSRPLP